MSLRLSKEHGLNPSVNTCFWCGESKNEIILFGNSYKHGKEAPMSIAMDYEPCEACAKLFEQGILLIEVSKTPLSENQLSIDKKRSLYPTGNHWVISKEGIERIFDQEMSKQVLSVGMSFIDHETATRISLFEAYTEED